MPRPNRRSPTWSSAPNASGSTALGQAAPSCALLSDGPAAEAEYLTALADFEENPSVVYLARTTLGYGEWLRRYGRRVDARRTVEWHMGKIFTKSGVRSRKELRSLELPTD